MTMTRRGFLKLAVAGAAVAIVPVQVVEAIAPVLPEPTKPAEVIGRRLWQVWSQQWTECAGGLKVDLELVAGSVHIDLGMYFDPSTSIDFTAFEGIELDVRMVDRKLQVFIDDKPAVGVYRFVPTVEREFMSVTTLDDPIERRIPGLYDDEPLKQLTAYKQLRGEKP